MGELWRELKDGELWRELKDGGALEGVERWGSFGGS